MTPESGRFGPPSVIVATTVLLSEANARDWRRKVAKVAPVFGISARSLAVGTSHNLRVPRESAEASVLPSGEKATQLTAPLCPATVARAFPPATS
jgi:hypothetical protein